ncbi:MAG TPA: nuclear transport factor 2 family protein [Puia sp.]|nr:nuclear transport factor 2 family protein [Puia sp.]
MTTQQVADRFYELDAKHDFQTIYSELYSQNAKSIEPAHSAWGTVQGMEAIHEKGKKFGETIVEMHDGHTEKPIVAGNFFACAMGFDATMKDRGRVKMEEIALYEVKDGKIVAEQFFY